MFEIFLNFLKSDELSIATLRLFEVILQKTDKTTIENLISRNLMSRTYRKSQAELEREQAESKRLPELDGEGVVVWNNFDLFLWLWKKVFLKIC